MILEALHFAAAYPLSRRRRPSEIASSVSLWSRARRCAKAWGPHEENCKAFIEEKTGQLLEHRTVAVLGSGLARDIPLEFLSRRFKRVELYDLVHLPAVRWKVRRAGLENVVFFERDLAEGLGFLHAIENLDLAISANVLSQMALKSKADEPQHLVSAHLSGLLEGPWTPCLITDISYEARSPGGEILHKSDLLAGVTPPPAFRAWDWTVAPLGEVSRNHETVHQVIAV
jgi:hypothetical protein